MATQAAALSVRGNSRPVPPQPDLGMASVSRPFKKIVTGVCTFFGVCVIAVIGYMSAGWGLMDSIYMVIITIFGVGYGEVHPITSPILRSFTIFVIVGGYAAAIYAVGGFMQMLTEGEINRALGARRMTLGIEKLSGHAIICGFGRIGGILARQLHDAKKPFVVVDSDSEKIAAAEALGYLVVVGNATQDDVLERAGIRRALVLASVLPDDAANVFITLTASELNRGLTIIARAENPLTEKKLLRSGARQVILPAAIGAQRIADLIIRPSAESFLDRCRMKNSFTEELGKMGLQFAEMQVQESSSLVGNPISEIEVRGNQGFLIVAVRLKNGMTMVDPSADTKLSAGDIVIVLGHNSDIPQLEARYAMRKQITYRGSTINV